MPRAQVKTFVSKEAKLNFNELNHMFEQMTGSASADPEVLMPKFERAIADCKSYSKVLNILLGVKVLEQLNEDEALVEIQNFSKSIDAMLAKYETLADDLQNKWNAFKEETQIKNILITTGALHKHEHYLKSESDTPGDTNEPAPLKDGFIKREPGLEMKILSFASLDLKRIWANDDATQAIKRLILSVLAKLHLLGFSIYDAITSPNVDIKKFSRLLIDSIDNLKTKIPRCDQAFKIIADSVRMLEDRFKTYFRESVESNNPNIIIENFITDVSLSQKGNLQIIMQFKRIVSFLRQHSNNANDPRLKSLFNIINSKFSAFEKAKDNTKDNDKESDKESDKEMDQESST